MKGLVRGAFRDRKTEGQRDGRIDVVVVEEGFVVVLEEVGTTREVWLTLKQLEEMLAFGREYSRR